MRLLNFFMVTEEIWQVDLGSRRECATSICVAQKPESVPRR